jgi:hypothetical protein
MFSRVQKRKIAAEIEKLLLSFNHPEMPKEKVNFSLHVSGKDVWSCADIDPNGSIGAVEVGTTWDEYESELRESEHEVMGEFHPPEEAKATICRHCRKEFLASAEEHDNAFCPKCLGKEE